MADIQPYSKEWEEQQFQLLAPQIIQALNAEMGARGADFGGMRQILADRLIQARNDISNKAADFRAQIAEKQREESVATQEKIREEQAATTEKMREEDVARRNLNEERGYNEQVKQEQWMRDQQSQDELWQHQQQVLDKARIAQDNNKQEEMADALNQLKFLGVNVPVSKDANGKIQADFDNISYDPAKNIMSKIRSQGLPMLPSRNKGIEQTSESNPTANPGQDTTMQYIENLRNAWGARFGAEPFKSSQPNYWVNGQLDKNAWKQAFQNGQVQTKRLTWDSGGATGAGDFAQAPDGNWYDINGNVYGSNLSRQGQVASGGGPGGGKSGGTGSIPQPGDPGYDPNKDPNNIYPPGYGPGGYSGKTGQGGTQSGSGDASTYGNDQLNPNPNNLDPSQLTQKTKTGEPGLPPLESPVDFINRTNPGWWKESGYGTAEDLWNSLLGRGGGSPNPSADKGQPSSGDNTSDIGDTSGASSVADASLGYGNLNPLIAQNKPSNRGFMSFDKYKSSPYGGAYA